ncbi:MAG TPA: DUF5723 family protein [Prolixibacteraceae bacterium]|nr:DUF5723 family protein [Prolixibacteraceae bacterium]
MRYTNQIIVVFLLLLIGISTQAQKNYVYDMQQTELQSGLVVNPANLVKTGADEFSFAPFGNFSFDLFLPYSVNQVFTRSAKGAIQSINIKKIAGNSGSKKNLLFHSSFDWLHFSGKKGNAVWRFAIEERLVGTAKFQNNFMYLMNSGNVNFLGKDFYMGLSLGELHLRSINFSWAQTINEKLNLGITSKFYSGRSLIAGRTNLYLYTDKKLEYIDMGINGEGKASIPVTIDDLLHSGRGLFSLFNYIFGIHNPGFGVDIGATYQLNPKIELSANLADLGFIYWNRNTTSFISNSEYRWQGIDLSENIDMEQLRSFRENNSLESFRDSFLNQLIVPSNEPYSTLSPLGFNIGVNYQMNEKIRLAAFLQNTHYLYHSLFNIGFASTFALGKKFGAVSGINFTNHSTVSIPAGISFNGNYFNASVMLNNLIGILAPSSTKNFGGSINFSFVMRKKKPITTKNETTPTNEFPFFNEELE